jgi:hypothetical protein
VANPLLTYGLGPGGSVETLLLQGLSAGEAAPPVVEVPQEDATGGGGRLGAGQRTNTRLRPVYVNFVLSALVSGQIARPAPRRTAQPLAPVVWPEPALPAPLKRRTPAPVAHHGVMSPALLGLVVEARGGHLEFTDDEEVAAALLQRYMTIV